MWLLVTFIEEALIGEAKYLWVYSSSLSAEGARE